MAPVWGPQAWTRVSFRSGIWMVLHTPGTGEQYKDSTPSARFACGGRPEGGHRACSLYQNSTHQPVFIPQKTI